MVAKDQNFYDRKEKQGAAEGSMKRAATKVHDNSNKFITLILQVGSTAYKHCKGIIVLSHCKIHYCTNCTSVYLPRVEKTVSGGLESSLGGCVIVGVMV